METISSSFNCHLRTKKTPKIKTKKKPQKTKNKQTTKQIKNKTKQSNVTNILVGNKDNTTINTGDGQVL